MQSDDPDRFRISADIRKSAEWVGRNFAAYYFTGSPKHLREFREAAGQFFETHGEAMHALLAAINGAPHA